MTIIHCCGICLITEASSDEVVVKKRKIYNNGLSYSRAYVFGREVLLTGRESTVLELLMSNAGTFVSREKILDSLNDNGEINFRAIDVLIKRLRKKLFPTNKEAGRIFIVTKYCLGYQVPTRVNADF